MKELDGKFVAIVRVRGIRNVKPKIRKTLDLLKISKPNYMNVYKMNKALIGMFNVVKDYTTFGEVSLETIKKLLSKRGEIGSRKLTDEEVNKYIKELEKEGKISISPFRLHPPRKGWKSIKRHYPLGSLGKRENMDQLLIRMM